MIIYTCSSTSNFQGKDWKIQYKEDESNANYLTTLNAAKLKNKESGQNTILHAYYTLPKGERGGSDTRLAKNTSWLLGMLIGISSCGVDIA